VTQLFEQFSPVSKSDWLEKIEKDLKGKSTESLNLNIEKDLNISPFAHADDWNEAPSPILQGRNTNNWEIGLRILVSDLKTANGEALIHLSGGAKAICFELENNLQEQDLKILLHGIQLEWISVHFIINQNFQINFLTAFSGYLVSQKYDPHKISCSISINEDHFALNTGTRKLEDFLSFLPLAKLFTVRIKPASGDDQSVIEELAVALATGNRYIDQMMLYGMNIRDYHQRIQFSLYSIGDNYFLNIARIRALKILWQQVLQAWNKKILAKTPIAVHLNTYTQTDNEHYNKIKATAQAMAAIVGGIDQLFIYPSDQFKNETGSPFAQRIAINIQHLMQLESYMDRVVDPGAGSYYIENLTMELASQVWKRFQSMA